MKEYTDLGGVGIPDCENMFALATSATHGSISLNPTGDVYPAGTPVTLTAFPNSGYTFDSWSGDL